MLAVVFDPAALGASAPFEAEARSFIDWVRSAPLSGSLDADPDAWRKPERRSRRERALGIPIDPSRWPSSTRPAPRSRGRRADRRVPSRAPGDPAKAPGGGCISRPGAALLGTMATIERHLTKDVLSLDASASCRERRG